MRLSTSVEEPPLKDPHRPAEERRSFPRLAKAVSLRVAKLAYPLPKKGSLGTLKDINAQGLCCRIPRCYQPGTPLSLEIDLKGWHRYKRGLLSVLQDHPAKTPLTAIAQVIWCRSVSRGKAYEIGVRFTDIHEDDRLALMRYLEKSLKSLRR